MCLGCPLSNSPWAAILRSHWKRTPERKSWAVNSHPQEAACEQIECEQGHVRDPNGSDVQKSESFDS